MFPNVDGFHWTPGHLIFLGIFFLILTTIAITVASALGRAVRDFRAKRVETIGWESCFHDLEERDRVCRHEFTGEFRHRTCDKGFDCRGCETHAKLVERIGQPKNSEDDTVFGLPFPDDRMYHRGHTWVHLEADGTLTVGLDELAKRLVGPACDLEPPPPGTQLAVNGTAWKVRHHVDDARILSPIEGEVIGVELRDGEQVLRIRAAQSPKLTHLLRGAEVRPWILRELERLQIVMAPEAQPSMADGGELMKDLPAAHPEADWSAVWGEMFLDA